MFACSRMAGWTSHILEQLADNRLIRPQATYSGPAVTPFVPINERGRKKNDAHPALANGAPKLEGNG
jgi:Citrate synthase, C-terminal domain